jgi:uncharacterized protein (TIGR03663 family)
MHTDEAVHAVKFGTLLENNDYKYDPFEYHGPTLNYFTLLPAWLSATQTFAEISELHLRIVPLAFGLLLLGGFLFLQKELGKRAVLFGVFFLAVSPAFVFFSRYYIQEMLFVCFSFYALIGLYKFLAGFKTMWAVLAGISIGLLFATKETSIITLAAFGPSTLFMLFFIKQKRPAFKVTFWLKLLAGLCCAVLIAVLFYYSFFAHPRGIVDSILTFKTYLNRGTGEHQAHLYPWYYYFKWLAFNHMPGRPFWSEGLILLLALFGVSKTLFFKHNGIRNHFLIFILIITLLLIIVYSSIPYKTPWSMLPWFSLIIVFAGSGASFLFDKITGKKNRIIIAILLSVGSVHLIYQSVLLNNTFAADVSNPYVYAHSSPDMYLIKEKIDSVSIHHPAGKNMYIEVICPGSDYWPLPWYLRDYPNVGYWDKVNMQDRLAEIVIAQPIVESELLKKMYEVPPPGQRNMYLPLFEKYTELRPFVEIRGYIRKDLFDKYYYNQP